MTALADRRLRHLYEISTLLTRFAGIDQTLPQVVDVAARALSIRTAVLVLDTNEGIHAHVWKTDAASAESLESALAHAHSTYGWFAKSVALGDGARAPPSVRPLPMTTFSKVEAERPFRPRSCVALPLVVRRSHVFGVLQVESSAALDEVDVLFLDAATNQVAIAIDRQASIDAAEARMNAQLDFTRAITGSLGEGVIAIDAHGRITFVNPAAERILGRPSRAVLGEPAGALLQVRRFDDDGDRVDCPLVAALETHGAVVSDDHAFVAADGHPIPVSYVACPISGARGTTGAVIAFRDVLAVKLTERAQRLLAECSAALGESLERKDMIRALAERLVPRFADSCFVDDADPRDVVAHVATAPAELVVPLRARGRSFGTLTLVMAHSRRRYAEADVELAEEIGRRTAPALDNARLHAETAKAVRDREEILAIVSHDLRSPLNTVVMAAAAMRDRRRRPGSPGGDALELGAIERAATRMLRMTRDLLDASSIEENQLAIQPRPTPVDGIMRDLMESLQATAAGRSLELTTTQTDPTLVAFCDPDRILQVLTNLVGNAIKFTPPGGRIDVAVEEAGDVVRFVVCDTGAGIAPDLLPHVFDRGRQAAETASQGRGLGLFITRGIVEAHGGRIRVVSERGVGTAFEFHLPRVVPRPIVKTTPAGEAPRDAAGTDVTRAGSVGRA